MPDDDDGIRTALTGSGEWAEQHARLPGPRQARGRARTRSTAAVAGAAVLTALAVCGTVLGVSQLGAEALPGPTTAAARPVPGPSGTPDTGVPTTIPDDFDLRTDVPEGPEYTVRDVDDLPDGICPGAAVPGLDTATDRTFRQVTGPEYNEVVGLAVFGDAGGASAFMTGLRDAAAACADGVPRAEGGTREAVQQALPGAWATGLATLLVDVPTPGGDPQPVVGSFLYAARVGSAVVLHYSAGEYLLSARPFTIDPGLVAMGRAPLDGIAPRMCRWTVAGC